MISTLENISEAIASPAVTPKFIAKSEHHKVHALADGKPICGGGNGAKSVKAWQTDIGPVNCAKCLAILEKGNV